MLRLLFHVLARTSSLSERLFLRIEMPPKTNLLQQIPQLLCDIRRRLLRERPGRHPLGRAQVVAVERQGAGAPMENRMRRFTVLLQLVDGGDLGLQCLLEEFDRARRLATRSSQERLLRVLHGPGVQIIDPAHFSRTSARGGPNSTTITDQSTTPYSGRSSRTRIGRVMASTFR